MTRPDPNATNYDLRRATLEIRQHLARRLNWAARTAGTLDPRAMRLVLIRHSYQWRRRASVHR